MDGIWVALDEECEDGRCRTHEAGDVEGKPAVKVLGGAEGHSSLGLVVTRVGGGVDEALDDLVGGAVG